MKPVLLIVAVMSIGGLAYATWPTAEQNTPTVTQNSTSGRALAKVVLPEDLSPNAGIGKLAYDAKCAACHGENAAGQDGVAPPLVHRIYEPNHHGDESFQIAAANGVRAHHWTFGNMPAVDGLTRGDVTMIVAYIRELQRSNGIN
jgi:cytochrome c